MCLSADLYGEEDSDAPDDYDIVLTESKRFKSTFHVPKLDFHQSS